MRRLDDEGLIWGSGRACYGLTADDGRELAALIGRYGPPRVEDIRPTLGDLRQQPRQKYGISSMAVGDSVRLTPASFGMAYADLVRRVRSAAGSLNRSRRRHFRTKTTGEAVIVTRVV